MKSANPRVYQYETVEEVRCAVAETLSRAARDVLRTRERFLLVLSGGSTPKGLYGLLSTPRFRDRIDWSSVEFFWGDERAVPSDHPDSNYRMARESLLAPLQISPRRIHRIRAEDKDLDGVAAGYQKEIALGCGVAADGPPPVRDLVLLGMGSDGHTASLFPHTEGLRETRRWVVANPIPQLGTHRFTMTPPLLNRAHQVLFLVTGSDKAERLAEVIEGPEDPGRLPSQLVRPVSQQMAWFVDGAASSRLRCGKSRSSAGSEKP